MSIAKSAPSTAPVVLEPNLPPATGFTSFQYDGVDISLFEAMGVNYLDEVERGRLKDIHTWISSELEEKTIGNVMMKLRDVENKLGAVKVGERRVNKIWNYLRISQRMKDMDLQRKALER